MDGAFALLKENVPKPPKVTSASAKTNGFFSALYIFSMASDWKR